MVLTLMDTKQLMAPSKLKPNKQLVKLKENTDTQTTPEKFAWSNTEQPNTVSNLPVKASQQLLQLQWTKVETRKTIKTTLLRITNQNPLQHQDPLLDQHQDQDPALNPNLNQNTNLIPHLNSSHRLQETHRYHQEPLYPELSRRPSPATSNLDQKHARRAIAPLPPLLPHPH